MKKIMMVGMFTAVLALAGCDQPSLPQVLGNEQQAPAQQASSGISPLGAGVIGAAAGYMLGKRNGAQHTTIVQPTPNYNGYSRYAAPHTVTTTTVKRGMFGRTVTRTVSRRR
jgi:hypothetical protein